MEDKEIQKHREHVGAGLRGLDNIEPQQDDDETDIRIVHVTVGPREFIGEMDMLMYPNYPNGELRLHNAVMVLYQNVGVEGEKVKTLPQPSGEVSIHRGGHSLPGRRQYGAYHAPGREGRAA